MIRKFWSRISRAQHRHRSNNPRQEVLTNVREKLSQPNSRVPSRSIFLQVLCAKAIPSRQRPRQVCVRRLHHISVRVETIRSTTSRLCSCRLLPRRLRPSLRCINYIIVASTPVRCIDYIIAASTLVRCIDYIHHAERAASDKAKLSCINSRLLFTFVAPDTRGLRYAS
jgi:hypothetical protein